MALKVTANRDNAVKPIGVVTQCIDIETSSFSEDGYIDSVGFFIFVQTTDDEGYLTVIPLESNLPVRMYFTQGWNLIMVREIVGDSGNDIGEFLIGR